MGRGRGRPVHGYRGTVANRRENTRSGRTRSESRRKERKKKACLDKLRTYKRDKRRYLRLCRRVKVQAEKSFSIPECSSSSSSFLFFFFFASKQRFRSGISNRRRGGKEEGEEDGFRSWKFVLDDRWGRGVGEAQRNRRTWIDDGDAAAVRERNGQAIEGGEAGGERLATLHSAGAERSPSRRNVEIITRSTDHAKYKYNCKLEIITRSTEI